MNYEGAGYIYAITNTRNGNRYIGSTIHPEKRWGTHRRLLRSGKHHSFVLQAAWDKHTEEVFSFSILAVCPAPLRTFYEECLMPLAAYNIMRTRLQRVFSAAKISAALTGVPKTVAHRKAISEGKSGMKMDAKFKNTARQRQLGVPITPETKAKISRRIKAARAAEAACTFERVQKVYRAYTYGGPSIATLCAEVGLDTTTFYSTCVRVGLPSIKAEAVRKVVAAVMDMRREGYSLRDVATFLGVKYATLTALLRSHNTGTA